MQNTNVDAPSVVVLKFVLSEVDLCKHVHNKGMLYVSKVVLHKPGWFVLLCPVSLSSRVFLGWTDPSRVCEGCCSLFLLNLPNKLKKAFTQFRCKNNMLSIEAGSHHNIPRAER